MAPDSSALRAEMLKPRLLLVGSFVSDAHRFQGGINAQCRLLVAALAPHIDLILLDSTPSHMLTPPLFVRLGSALRRLARLVYILLRNRPDAAFIYSSGGSSFVEKGVMVLLIRVSGLPVVWSMVSGVFVSQVDRVPLFDWLARLFLQQSTKIMCQGKTWVRFFSERLRIEPSKMFVIHNWIAPSRIRAEPRAIRRGSCRILFVGHVLRSKGVLELVDALSGLPDVEADIVGDGNAMEEVRSRILECAASERILLHGWRTGADLRRFYDRADVLVLPSHAEGFPNVVLEAMASALPVIVTPVGAIPDIVAHGVNGLVVPVGDSTAIRGAIQLMASDPEMCLAMGERNRHAARAHAVDHAADRLIGELVTLSPVFKRALSRASSG